MQVRSGKSQKHFQVFWDFSEPDSRSSKTQLRAKYLISSYTPVSARTRDIAEKYSVNPNT